MLRQLAFALMLIASAPAVAQSTPAAAQPAQQAPAGTTADAAQLFGARSQVHDVDLSPSGARIAFIGPRGERGSALYVVEVGQSGAAPRMIATSSGNPDRLQWCRFVAEDRLVCRFSAVLEQEGLLVPFSRLIALDSNGGNLRELGQQSSGYDARLRQFDGSILDWLPGENGMVLMSRDYVPEAGLSAGSHIYRRDDGLGVDRIDTRTLRATRVESPSVTASSYMTDGRGNVRIMSSRGRRGATGQAADRTEFFYRVPGNSRWLPFSTVTDAGEGMLPLAIDAARNAAYALRRLNGRYALYRVSLDGSLSSELVYANERVDVNNILRLNRDGRTIGVTFTEESSQSIYFDPEYQQLAANLRRALPNLPQIGFVAASADGQKLLIHAGADNDPGRYFLFDRRSRQLGELMLSRPQLEGWRLARVQAITYPAADGTSIPAYLTLPPQGEGRNLPAIVLPHGGPEARDDWSFDWLAQYFAHLGYAVLQPNFRGSAGYGVQWLQQNGFRSWRTSIGDISDGARWLASQGIAEPRRIAIAGWSYGGYAALQAAATEPALFRGVIAIAPVTDLRQLLEDGRGYTSSRNLAEYIGSGAHLTEGSPLQNVGRIAVPVLLFHGDRDLNVNVIHSRRMDAALRAANKQSELTVFPALSHDLDDSAARTRMLGRIRDFLGQHVSGPR